MLPLRESIYDGRCDLGFLTKNNMREIKFKCYKKDGKTGEVYSSVHPVIVSEYSVSTVSTQSNTNKVIGYCQFTGLKDKNGTEIYEDDIVRFVGGPCHVLPAGTYQYDAHPIGTELVVRCLLSGFTLQRKECINHPIPNLSSNVTQYNFWNNHTGLEVIGNIYQNPELLQP